MENVEWLNFKNAWEEFRKQRVAHQYLNGWENLTRTKIKVTKPFGKEEIDEEIKRHYEWSHHTANSNLTIAPGNIEIELEGQRMAHFQSLIEATLHGYFKESLLASKPVNYVDLRRIMEKNNQAQLPKTNDEKHDGDDDINMAEVLAWDI